MGFENIQFKMYLPSKGIKHLFPCHKTYDTHIKTEEWVAQLRLTTLDFTFNVTIYHFEAHHGVSSLEVDAKVLRKYSGWMAILFKYFFFHAVKVK